MRGRKLLEPVSQTNYRMTPHRKWQDLPDACLPPTKHLDHVLAGVNFEADFGPRCLFSVWQEKQISIQVQIVAVKQKYILVVALESQPESAGWTECEKVGHASPGLPVIYGVAQAHRQPCRGQSSKGVNNMHLSSG